MKLTKKSESVLLYENGLYYNKQLHFTYSQVIKLLTYLRKQRR